MLKGTAMVFAVFSVYASANAETPQYKKMTEVNMAVEKIHSVKGFVK